MPRPCRCRRRTPRPRLPARRGRSGRSVISSTLTSRLETVTNGSPWFGRSNGTARLIHGIQRYSAYVPPERVNIQSDSVEPRPERRAIGDLDGRRDPGLEDPAERDDERLVLDLDLDLLIVDGRVGHLEPPETRGDGVQLDPVDGRAAGIRDDDRRRDVDHAGPDGDRGVHVVGRVEVEARPPDRPGDEADARRLDGRRRLGRRRGCRGFGRCGRARRRVRGRARVRRRSHRPGGGFERPPRAPRWVEGRRSRRRRPTSSRVAASGRRSQTATPRSPR